MLADRGPQQGEPPSLPYHTQRAWARLGTAWRALAVDTLGDGADMFGQSFGVPAAPTSEGAAAPPAEKSAP